MDTESRRAPQPLHVLQRMLTSKVIHRLYSIGVAASIVIATGAASSCGQATGSMSETPRTHNVQVAASPATATTQSQALADILAGVQGAGISARLSAAPANFSIPPRASWVTVDMPAPSDSAGAVAANEPYWAAGLVAGALRDTSASAQFPALIGYSIQLPGSAVATQSTRIDGTLGDVVVPPETDAALTSRIETNSASAGLHVTSITLLHPMGVAAVVQGTVSDAQTFAQREAFRHLWLAIGLRRGFTGRLGCQRAGNHFRCRHASSARRSVGTTGHEWRRRRRRRYDRRRCHFDASSLLAILDRPFERRPIERARHTRAASSVSERRLPPSPRSRRATRASSSSSDEAESAGSPYGWVWHRHPFGAQPLRCVPGPPP